MIMSEPFHFIGLRGVLKRDEPLARHVSWRCGGRPAITAETGHAVWIASQVMDHAIRRDDADTMKHRIRDVDVAGSIGCDSRW